MSKWKEVSWFEAAGAYVAGTHDVERRASVGAVPSGRVVLWQNTDASFIGNGKWEYRIREKTRTITVTIPRPTAVHVEPASFGGWLCFARYETDSEARAALTAFGAAMRSE